jgi:hypothetical protein
MKWKSLIIAAVLLGCLGCNKATETCSAGPDEKCPSTKDYARIKTFQDKYKPPEDEQDEINGIWIRLQNQPPAGYHWDGNKLLYVKNPQAPPPPTAPATK